MLSETVLLRGQDTRKLEQLRRDLETIGGYNVSLETANQHDLVALFNGRHLRGEEEIRTTLLGANMGAR